MNELQKMKIKKRYSEPHRFYHNYTHIDYMFKTAEQNGVEVKEGSPLWYAIMYHDIIYDPTRKDNELKSSELFQKDFFENFNELQKENIHKIMTPNYNFSNLVSSLILLTKTHTVDRDMWLDDQLQIAKNLIDLDLAILGDTWEVYQEYVSNVRKEYSHATDKEWKDGRSKWLMEIIEKKNIYYTDWGEKRGGQALKNMMTELNNLRLLDFNIDIEDIEYIKDGILPLTSLPKEYL